jgi:hypothetical protein
MHTLKLITSHFSRFTHYNPAMRKIIPLLLAVLGLLALVYVLYANRERRYPEATVTLLNHAETQWYSAGIMDYRLVVEVAFAAERRQYTVVVQNGEIIEASLAYRDEETWTTPEPVSFDHAARYTIPGLFNALRLELNQNLREEIRVDVNADPAYLRYMYFGRVWLENEPMADSEARFTVTEFESPIP